MFGFYDPASLDVAGRNSAINFINASNGETTRVSIDNGDKARQIAEALDGQARFGIASLDGAVEELRGSIMFLPGHPDEALIAPEGDPRKTIPAKMAFDVEPGDIPVSGYVVAHGVSVDGAMMIHKIAMRSHDYVPPAPQSEASDNGPH